MLPSGNNSSGCRPLPEDVKVKGLVAQGGREKRGILEDCLFGDGDEQASLLRIRCCRLRIESVESGEAYLLREKCRDEFGAVSLVDVEIELRE